MDKKTYYAKKIELAEKRAQERKTYYANKRHNYHAERERRAIENRRKELQRQEERALRDRINRRNKNLASIRSNTRSTFSSMSVGRFANKFVSGVSTGNIWHTFFLFIICFALLSQLFFNTNLGLISGSGLNSDGFIKEEVLEENFKPYDYFDWLLSKIQNHKNIALDGVFDALDNFDSILARFDYSSGSSLSPVFNLIGDIFFPSLGFLDIIDGIERIGQVLANIFNIVVLIVNVVYLIVCFFGVGIDFLLLILELLGIIS